MRRLLVKHEIDRPKSLKRVASGESDYVHSGYHDNDAYELFIEV